MAKTVDQADPQDNPSDNPPAPAAKPPAKAAAGTTASAATAEPTTGDPTGEPTTAEEGAPKTGDPAKEGQELMRRRFPTKEARLQAMSEAASKYHDQAEALERFHSGIVSELGRQGADVGRARQEAEEMTSDRDDGEGAISTDEELADLMLTDPVRYQVVKRSIDTAIQKEIAREAAAEQYGQATVQAQRNEALERSFYEDNPDLSEHKKHVRAAGFLLANSAEIDWFSLDPAQRATLLANEARELIHGDREGSSASAQAPPVSPSTQSSHAPAAPTAPLSLEERAVQQWAKQNDEMEAKLNRRLGIPPPRGEP